MDGYQVIIKQSSEVIGLDKYDSLEQLTKLVTDKFTKPLQVSLDNGIVTIQSAVIQKKESDKKEDLTDQYKWRIPPVDGVAIKTITSTINLTNGATTGDFNDNPALGLAVGSGEFVQLGVEVRSNGKYYVVWGSAQSTKVAAELEANEPGWSKSKALAVFSVVLENNGTAGEWLFNAPLKSDISIVYGGGGAGGGEGGGAGGGEEVASVYSIWWKKVIASATDASNNKGGIADLVGIDDTASNVILTADKTLQLSYDADKTITVSVNDIVMSAAPAFSVNVGDIISQGLVHTQINTVTDQTHFTVDDGSVLTNGAACISQTVHSQELMDIGTNDQKASAHFTDIIYDAMIDYRDSAQEIIGTEPDIAYSLCTNSDPSIGAYWSNIGTRPQDLIGYITETMAPSAGTKMRVRFFANKTAGNGIVTLDEFRVGFGRQSYNPSHLVNDFAARYILDTSLWLTKNCTVNLIGGKTRITPNFRWDAFRNVTGATRQLMVDVNNSRCYFSTEDGITNGIDDIYMVPVSGDEQTVEFSKDLTVGATEDVLIVGHMHDAGGVDVSVFSTRLGLIENRVVYKVVGDGDTVSGKNFTLPYTPKNNDMVDVYRGFNSLSLQDEVSSDESTGEYTLSGTSLALGTDLQESEKLVVKLWRLT